MIVRAATREDMAAVRDIYNALIPTTTVAWTETRQTLDERLAWFDAQEQRGHPVLVAERLVDGGERAVVGFAAYGDFRGAGRWPGYRHTVENTVHVAEEAWGIGAGRVLMEALIDAAVEQGMHVMVAAIDSDNDVSIRFHEGLGFSVVGTMPEVGRKFDRWLDLVLMQRILD